MAMNPEPMTPQTPVQVVFEFFESRPPGERPPLFDTVAELAAGIEIAGVRPLQEYFATGLPRILEPYRVTSHF